MAPCARLYAYLACQLALQHPRWRASPYARWVESYSGAEYLVGLACASAAEHTSAKKHT